MTVFKKNWFVSSTIIIEVWNIKTKMCATLFINLKIYSYENQNTCNGTST